MEMRLNVHLSIGALVATDEDQVGLFSVVMPNRRMNRGSVLSRAKLQVSPGFNLLEQTITIKQFIVPKHITQLYWLVVCYQDSASEYIIDIFTTWDEVLITKGSSVTSSYLEILAKNSHPQWEVAMVAGDLLIKT